MPGSTEPAIPALGGQLLSMLLLILVALVIAALGTALVVTRLRDHRRPGRHESAWRVARMEPLPQRALRIGFGTLWIVDGLLQAQPRMPAGFISQVVAPGMAAGPSWLTDLADPLMRAWTHHPIAADAATVWVQVGLGLLMLLGGRGGVLELLVLWGSVAWGVVVWVFGEAFGGLLHPGASWLMGSPGAVLLYIAGALLLIAGRERSAATVSRWCRRTAASWLLIGACLQALPWEGNFSAGTLTDPFQAGSQAAQPGFLLSPIRTSLRLAAEHPRAVNSFLVGALLVIGISLWLGAWRGSLSVALVLCLATWWLAQDFGVIGGYGTDPNSALPLALLLVAGWPHAAPQPVSKRRRAHASRRLRERLAQPTRTGLTVAGIAALLPVPVILALSLLSPADATAVAADSGGGVLAVPHRHAPNFSLLDQHGRLMSMTDTRGKITLVTFLDPVCSDDCPVIANQIAAAVRGLGPLADQVEIIAVDSNPLFYQVSDVAAFTNSHGLADLNNWHFLAGSEPALRAVLDSYAISVAVPAVGMISHSEGIYFVNRDGQQVAYLGDGANPDLGSSYAAVIRDEIRKLVA